jgi:hypothetical protein
MLFAVTLQNTANTMNTKSTLLAARKSIFMPPYKINSGIKIRV